MTSSRPRLAYLTSVFPAVSHTFILREIEGLRALGFDVHAASVRQPDPAHLPGATEQEMVGTTFYILKAAKQGLTLPRAMVRALRQPRRLGSALKLALKTRQAGIKGTLYQLFYMIEAMILAQWLTDRKIDQLHSHFAQSSANVAMLAAELADIPFSYTLHGPADLYEPHRWNLSEKTARAAFVACISHFARAQAMLFSDPAHWSKLRIIHCGVIPEMYDQPETPSADTGLRLLFVGRIAPVKGLRVLLEALQAVLPEHPDMRLTIVGGGEDRKRLEILSEHLGDTVEFTGYLSQEEVAGAMAQADAFVLPSFAEGLPVVLMEALAAGKPVIGPRVAGVAELVEDGKTGFLVHAGDADGLADKLRALAADREATRKMGLAGRDVVRAEFDARIEAARIGALFTGTAGDALRPAPLADTADQK